MQKVRVLELFSGIGACSKALERLGIEHEIVDAVEIDKYAIASFNAVHGTNFEPQDITKWDKDIKCDLIMHGSPCQDFSVAGKGAGGDEGSGTRSSLLYETLRIVDKLHPKYVIWGNVRNLLSKKHVHNWYAYAERMEQMGYNNHAKILNAKDFGIPQNRERVFTISIRKDLDDNFKFPARRPLGKHLKDMLESEVDEKYYIQDATSLTYGNDFDIINGGRIGKMHDISRRAYHLDAIAPAMHTCGGGNQEPKIAIKTANSKGYDLAKNGDGIDLGYPDSKTRRGRVGHGVAKTIPTAGSQGVLDGFRIRKLTPKECWRLMGFDDTDYDKAAKVCSNSQLYKQAGNSIVVNVLEEIFKELLCK